MLEKLDTLIAFAVVMLGVSLIITILTQIVSTALGLRGSNLLWGVETLLTELGPGLTGAGLPPRTLAKQILQHQLISDSTFSRASGMWLIGPLIGLLSRLPGTGWLIDRWRLATAIRPEELVRMLERTKSQLAAGHAAIAQLDNLLNPAAEELKRKLVLLNNTVLPAGAPVAYTVQFDQVARHLTDNAQQSIGKLENWFTSTMDRVSQRFVLQIRLWTILFAFILAFGLHFDGFNLFNQLSTNPDTRAALVNLRDGMLSEAKLILPPSGGAAAATEVPVSADVLKEALDRMKKDYPAIPAALQIPAGTTTVQDAETSLNGAPGIVAGAYRKYVITVLRDHADKINKDLAKAGIQLIPSPYPGPLHFSGTRNVLGILLAAAFLSLGAPFWYNALKNVSNLRTVVATKEQQESQTA
jgi:hypothetical protein